MSASIEQPEAPVDEFPTVDEFGCWIDDLGTAETAGPDGSCNTAAEWKAEAAAACGQGFAVKTLGVSEPCDQARWARALD